MQWSIVDKYDTPVLFSSLYDLIIVVKDKQGNFQSFSKLLGTVVAANGGATNEYEFELSEAMTLAYESGKLSGRFTYKIPSAAHAGGILIDIIEEGISNEFITLQE